MSKIELTEEQKQQHRDHIKRINLAFQNVETAVQEYNRANAERWTQAVIPALEQCDAAVEDGNTFANEVAESLPDWSGLHERWSDSWMQHDLKDEFEAPSDVEFDDRTLVIDSEFVHLSHGLGEDENEDEDEDDECAEDEWLVEAEIVDGESDDDDTLREKVAELEATIRSLCVAGNTSRSQFVAVMSGLPEHLRQH